MRLLADLVGSAVLAIRPKRSVEAENLLLRRQLALFKERGAKPRRIDAATRVSLAWMSTLCDWRSCLVVVRPETVIRWPDGLATIVALQVAFGTPAHCSRDRYP